MFFYQTHSLSVRGNSVREGAFINIFYQYFLFFYLLFHCHTIFLRQRKVQENIMWILYLCSTCISFIRNKPILRTWNFDDQNMAKNMPRLQKRTINTILFTIENYKNMLEYGKTCLEFWCSYKKTEYKLIDHRFRFEAFFYYFLFAKK